MASQWVKSGEGEIQSPCLQFSLTINDVSDWYFSPFETDRRIDFLGMGSTFIKGVKAD